MAVPCAGCGGPIVEKTLLSALDRFWHIACLNCSCCGLRLDELGSSVFVRSNMLLCRQDYLKLFGLTGTCAKCRLQIPADELVMRCQDKVYHMNCFCCAQCHTLLHTGDKICLVNGSLFCEHEFPHLFSGNPKLLNTVRINTSAPPMDSHDHPLGRQQVEMVGQLPNGIVVRSPKSFNFNSQAYVDHSQSNGALQSNKLVSSMAQSDLITNISPIPGSPGTTLFFNSNNSNNMVPLQENLPPLGIVGSTSGFYPTEMMDQLYGESTMVPQQPITEKLVKPSSANANTTETSNGRKKQKKVDNRRCLPVRVC